MPKVPEIHNYVVKRRSCFFFQIFDFLFYTIAGCCSNIVLIIMFSIAGDALPRAALFLATLSRDAYVCMCLSAKYSTLSGGQLNMMILIETT